MSRELAPVLLVQWSPRDEREEAPIVSAALEADFLEPGGGRAPYPVPFMSDRHVVDPDPAVFLAALREEIGQWQNRQLLYVSAHGNTERVVFHATMKGEPPAPHVTFDQLADVLRETLGADDAISLVLGFCESLHHETPFVRLLPEQVDEVFGFTGKPHPNDVAALMAGVIADDMRLFEKLHRANEACFGAGVPFDQREAALARLVAEFDQILDEHQTAPEHFVQSAQGDAVRALCRTDYGAWLGPVRPLPGAKAGSSSRIPRRWGDLSNLGSLRSLTKGKSR